MNADAFTVVVGARRGKPRLASGADPAGFELNEAGWERVAELRRAASSGHPERALALLAAHAEELELRPGLRHLAQTLANVAFIETAARRRDWLARTLYQTGIVENPRDQRHTPALPDEHWEAARRGCLRRACRGELALTSERPDAEELARAFAPIFESEVRYAAAKAAADDSAGVLERMFARDYEALCDRLGWEQPAELIESHEHSPVVFWGDVLQVISRRPRGDERLVTERALERLAELWNQHHL